VPHVKETPTSLADCMVENGVILSFQMSDADYLVSVDNDPLSIKAAKSSSIDTRNRVLIRLEPRIVWPANYLKSVSDDFGFVVNVGRDSNSENNVTEWPQDWSQVDKYSNREKLIFDRVAVVCGNKMSFIPGELYSLRRECIYGIDKLDLYGTNWNKSFASKVRIAIGELLISVRAKSFPNHRGIRLWFRSPHLWSGSPEDKIATLSNYKYSLVIENSSSYLTEKLFDAFFARTIPIYVGPPVENFGIPRELVIQADPNVSSIKEAILQAEAMEFEAWKLALESWLYDPKTKQSWSVSTVHQRIVSMTLAHLSG
jgi:hypothetical protein